MPFSEKRGIVWILLILPRILTFPGDRIEILPSVQFQSVSFMKENCKLFTIYTAQMSSPYTKYVQAGYLTLLTQC